MRETSRTTFARLGARDCPVFHALTVGVAGSEKVTDRIGLGGLPGAAIIREMRGCHRCNRNSRCPNSPGALLCLGLHLHCPQAAAEWHCVACGKTRGTNTRLARMPDAVNPGTRTIGVDVGGTKVAAGFVDAQGEITRHTRTAMNPRGTAEEGLAAVTNAIDALLKMAPEAHGGVRPIGICAPGPLDPQTGVVLNPPNVPCWRNFPLAAEISRRYGSFVRIDNDANAAGLAEGLWGAGRGYKNAFYACIGTGVGTRILFDGRIYYGRTGAAAEGGHVIIDC